MKKVLFITLSISIFIFSCKDKNAYTLTGSLTDGAYNGKTVYLYEDSARHLVFVDSTLVENNQFIFKGIASEIPVIRLIGILYDDNAVSTQPVVLEKGDITAMIDSAKNLHVSGTPMNDAIQKFTDKTNELFSEMEKETDAKVQKGLLAELRQIIYEYVKPNITNPVGEYFFLNNSPYLKDNDILELIAASSPQFKANERVQRVETLAKVRIATAEGSAFVDVNGLTLDGKAAALSDYAGKRKVVLVDFWASWCGPCIRSLPDLKATYEKYKSKGFEIVGISLDNDGEAWKAATEKHAIVWPQFSNLKGWKEPAALSYGINAIPQAVLIDKEGIIVLRGIEISQEELENKLDKLLK